MNRGYRYLPFIVYSLLLMLLWVASLFLGVAELFTHSGSGFNNLFSGEGVRWALYTALQSVDAAPWGSMVMLLAAMGVVAESGLVSTLTELLSFRSLSTIRRYAGLLSLMILILFAVLLFFASLSPWRLLAGVTEDWSTSPLYYGWVLILFLLLLLVALMHGSVCGYYRSVSDVVRGLCSLFPLFAPAFMAVLPASGIMPCLAYVGLCDIGNMEFSSNVLCWLPFVYIALIELFSAVKRRCAE